MAETATILVGHEKQPHTIEVRPVTLVFTSPNMSAGPDHEYPGRVVVDTQQTLYHAERVKKLHPEFEKFWRLFMDNTSGCHPKPVIDYPVTADHIRTMGMGARHLMGLIDCLLKMQDKGWPVVARHPESFLHPGWQVALGDLFIRLSERGGGSGGTATATAPREGAD